MLKILLVAIAGVSIGAGAISYINYTNNQLIEEKFVYLQRDVKQLTREISKLNSNAYKQVHTNADRGNPTLTNIVKKSRTALNDDYRDSSVTQPSEAILEQRKRRAKEQALKKHLGVSVATN